MLLIAAAPAFASAYYFLDSGTRAIGRGGAFIAGADDLSAQYYNPAALANIDRTMLNLNGWAVSQYVRFDRADEVDAAGEPVTFDPVENESPPIYEPSIGFAAPLGGIHPILKNTTFALGMYVPTSPYLAYPTAGAQRYALIDSLIWQVYAGPSVAQEITPWLTVGVGLQYTFLRVEESLAATICIRPEMEDCAEGSDDPANDIVMDLETWDTSQFSWNAGVLLHPTPWMDVGLAVQPPITYEAPGKMNVSFGEDFFLADHLEGNSFTDEDVTLLVTVPLILRAGVQMRPNDKLRAELAGTWTNWSSLDQLVITDLKLTIPHKEDSLVVREDLVVTDDVNFVTGYQDAYSVRLGGDYLVRDWLQVRAGAHYESSAVPDLSQGVNLVDGSKVGFGAGATVTIARRVGIDVSAAEQIILSREITESELRQQSLYTNPADQTETAVTSGKVVGNGTFESRLTFLAVGATLYFGGSDEHID